MRVVKKGLDFFPRGYIIVQLALVYGKRKGSFPWRISTKNGYYASSLEQYDYFIFIGDCRHG